MQALQKIHKSDNKYFYLPSLYGKIGSKRSC